MNLPLMGRASTVLLQLRDLLTTEKGKWRREVLQEAHDVIEAFLDGQEDEPCRPSGDGE